jgi:hypothetical protein
MKKYIQEKTFVFHDRAEGLSTVVKSCIQYIEEQNEFLCVPANIHSQIKWTISELLLNGIKHSGSQTSRLSIKFSENGLVIEKEDNGHPFDLKVNSGAQKLYWPVAGNFLHQYFEVYRNGMDVLRIYTENEYSAVFSVEELEEEVMPQLLVNTSEHFGLMIIAKASNRLTYTYENSTGKNRFTVNFTYLT